MTQEPGYTFPNSVVTRTYQGNMAYAVQFDGDGNNLLYQLKNFMSFRGLMQSRMTRFSTDGTILIASSIVSPITKIATDFIDIDVRKSTFVTGVAGIPSCTINFLNLPTEIAPMRYPSEIHDGEIEGIDYLKTYYTLDIENCPTCSDELWNLCDISLPECDQFKFTDPSGYPSKEGDSNDHSVYSTSMCHIQLLGRGSDGIGNYIIIKIFTEWAWVTPENLIYSKTGLGYGLLWGQIQDAMGSMLCEVKSIIKVDCCLKPSENRIVWLWDESLQFPAPREFTIIRGNVYYKTPDDVVDLDQLYWYGAYGTGAFWVLPDYQGGCLPFTWELTGPGTLIPSPNSMSAAYDPPVDWVTTCQNTGVTIKVRDRCGTEDILVTDNCCISPDPLSIGYITLVMGCSDSQELPASGGCGPYTWSVKSGGGSITPTIGQATTYTAPSTNANCISNPTIEVTDCCGNSAQIQLAVNCYTTSQALAFFVKDGPYECEFKDTFWNWWGEYWRYSYNCSGVLSATSHYPYSHIQNFNCGSDGIFKDSEGTTCNVCCVAYQTCDALTPCYQECGLVDYRSVPQKEAGCCPINPLTGLPY